MSNLIQLIEIDNDFLDNGTSGQVVQRNLICLERKSCMVVNE